LKSRRKGKTKEKRKRSERELLLREQNSLGSLVLLLVIPIGIVVGFLLIAIYDYFLPPELEKLFSLVVFPVMLVIAVVSAFLIKADSRLNGLSSTGYKEQDPSIRRRVVRDGFEGEEIIVCGSEETTFAQACKDHWYFEATSMDSQWHIEDDYGNDITDKSLVHFEGISILIPD
jgi:hypothetical protein